MPGGFFGMDPVVVVVDAYRKVGRVKTRVLEITLRNMMKKEDQVVFMIVSSPVE